MNNSINSVYDKAYFDRIRPYSSGMGHIAVLYNAVTAFSPKRVLDVGCGEGYFVSKLLKHGIYALGMDVSPFAGTVIPDNFVQADATQKFPFGKSYDVCISADFFEHLEEKDIDFVYSEMCRIADHVLALISFKHEIAPIDTHKTIRNRRWWQDKLPGCIIL